MLNPFEWATGFLRGGLEALDTVEALRKGADAGEIVLSESLVNLGLRFGFPEGGQLSEVRATPRAPNRLLLHARYRKLLVDARVEVPAELRRFVFERERAELRVRVDTTNVDVQPNNLVSRIGAGLFLSVAKWFSFETVENTVVERMPQARRDGDDYVVDLREIPEVRGVLDTLVLGIPVFTLLRLEGVACRDGAVVIGVAGETQKLLGHLRMLVPSAAAL